MKTAQLFTLLSLGAALIFTPGSERLASADKDSHPVFKEHPGKHKGWDKDKHDRRHDKDTHGKHKGWDKHDRSHHRAADGKREHHHDRYADAQHERHHARRISSRTTDGYWHHHDGYPRHFHYSRRTAPVPPHRHGRQVGRFDDRVIYHKPAAGKDYKTINDTRKEISDGRDQLRNQHAELKKDQIELRRDIRSGASKDEIKKGRQEIREDHASIRKTREELANDRARLAAAQRGK
jgi:hypothetical protein